MDINEIELNKEAIDLVINLLTEAKDNNADKVFLFEYITGHSDYVKATILKGGNYTYKDVISYEEIVDEMPMDESPTKIEIDE